MLEKQWLFAYYNVDCWKGGKLYPYWLKSTSANLMFSKKLKYCKIVNHCT